MPGDVILVLIASMAIVGLAAWHGGAPERIGALIVGVDLAIDLAVGGAMGWGDFSDFSTSRFAIDLVELCLLLVLAMRANRLWPIGSAAAQLVAVGGSLVVFASSSGMTVAYWAVTQLPVVGQLAALALGTRSHVRREAALGRYRDWRRGG